MVSKRRLAAMLALVGGAIIWLHNVPTSATAEDQTFTDRILTEAGYARDRLSSPSTFEDEVAAVLAVQDAVIGVAKADVEIPFDHEREPRDLYEQKRGLCYDRSRAIEKMLAALGFDVRHVAVYSGAGGSAFTALLTPGTDSHALTEVRTKKGWMAVDPNVRWIALSAAGEPLTVAALRRADIKEIAWSDGVKAAPHPIFKSPYVYIRGLYSRHGRFYPPYSPIPDVNWGQLAQNFSE